MLVRVIGEERPLSDLAAERVPTKDSRITELEAEGYVVVKAKSYRHAQERQRIAEALRAAAERDSERSRDWARSVLEEERRLRNRCEFLYGVAVRCGATNDDLHVTVVPYDPSLPLTRPLTAVSSVRQPSTPKED